MKLFEMNMKMGEISDGISLDENKSVETKECKICTRMLEPWEFEKGCDECDYCRASTKEKEEK